MKLRGSRAGGHGGARVRRRRQNPVERLASAFSRGGREVEFGAVDGVYRAAEHEVRGQAMSAGSSDHPPARYRPAVHVYTAGGRTRSLMGALVGQHVDLFG